MSAPQRGDVDLISLSSRDPTLGREIQKTRPCVIISPDELNEHLGTFCAAPMTTGGHPYPFRIPCRFQGKDGFVVLDRLRTVDRARLVRRVGRVSSATLSRALGTLREMFSE